MIFISQRALVARSPDELQSPVSDGDTAHLGQLSNQAVRLLKAREAVQALLQQPPHRGPEPQVHRPVSLALSRCCHLSAEFLLVPKSLFLHQACILWPHHNFPRYIQARSGFGTPRKPCRGADGSVGSVSCSPSQVFPWSRLPPTLPPRTTVPNRA